MQIFLNEIAATVTSLAGGEMLLIKNSMIILDPNKAWFNQNLLMHLPKIPKHYDVGVVLCGKLKHYEDTNKWYWSLVIRFVGNKHANNNTWVAENIPARILTHFQYPSKWNFADVINNDNQIEHNVPPAIPMLTKSECDRSIRVFNELFDKKNQTKQKSSNQKIKISQADGCNGVDTDTESSEDVDMTGLENDLMAGSILSEIVNNNVAGEIGETKENDNGDRGDSGDSGHNGDNGDNGHNGDRGDRGDSGDNGDNGDRGDSGDMKERDDNRNVTNGGGFINGINESVSSL